MSRILVIGTGGTIASAREDKIRLDSPFRITDLIDTDEELVCRSPFSILSENMSLEYQRQLVAFIEDNAQGFDGIIILHGSDTLAYTAGVIGNIFSDLNIVLVAADKPIEDKDSNGVANMKNAIEHIVNSRRGVYVSYNGIHPALTLVSADGNDNFITAGESGEKIYKPQLENKNILIIKPYVGINYNNYRLDEVDAVLHEMYHSATAPEGVKELIDRCELLGIPFYFVTPKASADYESAEGFKSIIFNSTTENAYARLLVSERR